MANGRRSRVVVYRARDGWRWRLVAANGRIVAESGEAYTRKYDAGKAWRMVRELVKARR